MHNSFVTVVPKWTELLLCLISAAPAFSKGEISQAPVAMIIRINGEWRDLTHHAFLGKDDSLYADSKLSTPQTSGTNYLKIRITSTGDEARVDCQQDDCGESLLHRASPNTALKTFLTQALSVVQGSIAGYGGTFNRGASSNKLSDSVLTNSANSLDASALFAAADSGRYLLDWCPVSTTGAPNCPAEPSPLTIVWSQGGRVTLPMAPRPGLYRVFQCEQDGNQVLRQNSATVLVVSSTSKAATAKENLSQLSTLLSGWESDQRAVVLHAYMQSLATAFRLNRLSPPLPASSSELP